MSCCHSYRQKKRLSLMTPRKYKDGFSIRLFVAKETLKPSRMKLPVLLINLDGVIGYFDETKGYHYNNKSIVLLCQLS